MYINVRLCIHAIFSNVFSSLKVLRNIVWLLCDHCGSRLDIAYTQANMDQHSSQIPRDWYTWDKAHIHIYSTTQYALGHRSLNSVTSDWKLNRTEHKLYYTQVSWEHNMRLWSNIVLQTWNMYRNRHMRLSQEKYYTLRPTLIYWGVWVTCNQPSDD